MRSVSLRVKAEMSYVQGFQGSLGTVVKGVQDGDELVERKG